MRTVRLPGRVTPAALRCLPLALALSLAGCRVHETSAAEKGVYGRYYVAWAESAELVEFTMILEPVGSTGVKGRYVAARGPHEGAGAVEGISTDSVRLVLHGDAFDGFFRGVRVGDTHLRGQLFVAVPGAVSLSGERIMGKTKIEY